MSTSDVCRRDAEKVHHFLIHCAGGLGAFGLRYFLVLGWSGAFKETLSSRNVIGLLIEWRSARVGNRRRKQVRAIDPSFFFLCGSYG